MDPLRLSWVGGENDFALPLGRLRALQTSRNAGPEEVFNKLRLGTWHVDDLAEILRHGLIGGGMPEGEAGPMVVQLMAVHPLAGFKLTAGKVMQHALFGPPDDEVGKPQGEPHPQESGGSQKSTAKARSSGSRRKKSTE